MKCGGLNGKIPRVTGFILIHFEGGGLLNLPALFALADFHVFSVIYAALSCTEMASFAS